MCVPFFYWLAVGTIQELSVVWDPKESSFFSVSIGLCTLLWNLIFWSEHASSVALRLSYYSVHSLSCQVIIMLLLHVSAFNMFYIFIEMDTIPTPTLQVLSTSTLYLLCMLKIRTHVITDLWESTPRRIEFVRIEFG